MNIKSYLKSKATSNRCLQYVYNEIYLPIILRRRGKVNIVDRGVNNIVSYPRGINCPNLRIKFLGNNNKVIIGHGCNFYCSNYFHIQNDNNIIKIGDNVTFDQNVLLVCTEGSTIKIGSGSLFANGVAIRTGDQHFIFNENNERINPSNSVCVGEHVWLGDHAVVMKGVTIGNDSVVGASSMVLHDIPQNSVAVGTPAKVVKNGIRWEE